MMLKKQTTNPDDIACARRVIAQEVEGLQAVANSLDETFVAVTDLVQNLKGRLIVSGMGKSGHVARKIVATLASTGTPAQFVHPSEASHGDLGMITRDDAVMLLSNSGETAELHDMIAYCRRFNIPLIALVRRNTSMLVEAATHAIVLPEVAEASPVGAPTTSTTMMMAWGDALAVAVLERRGFTKEEFGVFHPGGKLGQALLRVENLMHTGDAMPLVSPNMLMKEALIEMTGRRFGMIGAMENGKLVGILTDGDLRRHMGDDLLGKSVRDVMNKNPVTISPGMLASQALGMMNEKRITCFFVISEAQEPIGMLHIHDCLRAGVR